MLFGCHDARYRLCHDFFDPIGLSEHPFAQPLPGKDMLVVQPPWIGNAERPLGTEPGGVSPICLRVLLHRHRQKLMPMFIEEPLSGKR
jgi:hypothetical protein